jgi:hypothetical protein
VVNAADGLFAVEFAAQNNLIYIKMTLESKAVNSP